MTGFEFSADGELLLTSGLEHTLVWDVSDALPLGPAFSGSNGTFSPDGRMIAVIDYDEILLVEAHTLNVLGRPLGAHEAYSSLAWGADGRFLVSSGGSESYVWDLDADSWRERACRIARRNLREEEAMLYLGRAVDQPTCPDVDTPPALPDDALSLLHRGDRYLARGDTARAAEPLRRAAALVEDSQDADLANQICWQGATSGLGAHIMRACERAVSLEPTNAGFRDSRGVARASVGDLEGALEDFRFYVEAYGEDANRGRRVDRRRVWVEAIEAGGNPFDALTLRALRNELF
jgi:WD40 repeat protein